MDEAIRQVSENAIQVGVLLFAAAIFIAILGWAFVQFMRMAQIVIATNVALKRELNGVISKGSHGSVPVQGPRVPIDNPEPLYNSDQASVGGECYAYDEELLADLEALRNLKKHSEREQGGLTDNELQEQIAAHRAAGYNEDEP